MKFIIKILVASCVISVFLIYTGAPIALIAAFVAIPIAIGIWIPSESRAYPITDYIELLSQCYSGNNTLNAYVEKAKQQITNFKRMERALTDISMVNFQSFAFAEYKDMLTIAEEAFSTSTAKLYSRCKVVKAKGYSNADDHKYILHCLRTNKYILDTLADFLNEVTNSNHKTMSVNKIIDFTNSLKKLNAI